LAYLVNLVHFPDIPRTLQSSVSQLFLQKTKLNIGKCAFSAAALTTWSQLPVTTESPEAVATFKKQLETFV